MLAGHSARELIYVSYFFIKNYTNIETLSFADFYAIRILDEGIKIFTSTVVIGTSTL